MKERTQYVDPGLSRGLEGYLENVRRIHRIDQKILSKVDN